MSRCISSSPSPPPLSHPPACLATLPSSQAQAGRRTKPLLTWLKLATPGYCACKRAWQGRWPAPTPSSFLLRPAAGDGDGGVSWSPPFPLQHVSSLLSYWPQPLAPDRELRGGEAGRRPSQAPSEAVDALYRAATQSSRHEKLVLPLLLPARAQLLGTGAEDAGGQAQWEKVRAPLPPPPHSRPSRNLPPLTMHHL